MGCQDTVWTFQKKGIDGHRLGGGYIRSGKAQFTGGKRIVQCLFLYQWTPGGIQQDGAGFHHGEGILIDHVTVLSSEGTVEGNNVAAPQQIFQRDIFADGFTLGATGAVIGQHLHAKGPGDPAHGTADAAKADDADGFSGQLHLGVSQKQKSGLSAHRPA